MEIIIIATGIIGLTSAIHLTKSGFVSNFPCQEQPSCAFPSSNFLEICLFNQKINPKNQAAAVSIL
ncbi:hypothetical protein [Candidatus Cardinium hertigii]|jgi:hypothetical protein|uniref:Uncharacterized protein n=1 Tax=Candidatus Cardinium hertigii TaxID=247481 RepID=A0A3N2QD21_9BACT|nr:hypothetical protein [Candidatus Cardinium hertigii]ROT47723.1 hypothetical protein EDM02_00940 [Candidatus Cardinium hertigii]